MKHSKGPWGQAATMSSDMRHIRYIEDDDGRAIADVRYADGADQGLPGGRGDVAGFRCTV